MLRPSSNNRLPDRGRRRGARQQGFTLVELLIGMALLMIVMLIAGAALSSSMRVKGREMQLVESAEPQVCSSADYSRYAERRLHPPVAQCRLCQRRL